MLYQTEPHPAVGSLLLDKFRLSVKRYFVFPSWLIKEVFSTIFAFGEVGRTLGDHNSLVSAAKSVNAE